MALSVGRRFARVDGFEKVTGVGKFVVDIRLPGMLHAKVLRSPYPHARVVHIDVDKALRVPGVRAIASHQNCSSRRYSGGASILSTVKDMKIFDSVVRFVGDGVAAVAAVSEEAAEEALQLLEVEYEPLQAVFDPEEAMAPGAPQIHPEVPEVKNNVARYVAIDHGDVEKGFREAKVVKEARFRTSRVQHATLEPHACVAQWDVAGRLRVWSSTQAPFGIRVELAEALGIPESRISVVHFGHVGGSFGGKMDSYQRETVAAVLAKMAQAPVRLEYTREEEFACSITRHPMIIGLKLGADAEGFLTAADFRVVADTGAYASDGPAVLGLVSTTPTAVYKVPNYRVRAYCVYTNNPVAGAFRGYGNPQATFAWESLVDELAEELQIDPVELRLKNTVKKGDPNRLAPGKTLLSCGLPRCLEEGAKRIGWTQRTPPALKTGRVRRGIGVACMMHNTGTGGTGRKPEHSAAFLKLNEDGTASLMTGVSDTGQGNVTGLAQIAAEELGIPPEQVLVKLGVDTDVSPFDLGSYASRCTYVAGLAVRQVAREVRCQLLPEAGKMLGVRADVLEVKMGRIFVPGEPGKEITVAEVVRAKEQAAQGATSFMAACTFSPDHNAPAFAAHFAEVEVDVETGQVRVLRMVAAHDVGRAINPSLLEGQLEGALQQGLGYALTEEVKSDRQGNVINARFSDYKLWTAVDMPPVEILLIEDEEPTGPFGAKGVAEPGLVPVAAAIANAIYNAVGVRMRELPMNPERMLLALGQGQK